VASTNRWLQRQCLRPPYYHELTGSTSTQELQNWAQSRKIRELWDPHKRCPVEYVSSNGLGGIQRLIQRLIKSTMRRHIAAHGSKKCTRSGWIAQVLCCDLS
jgi:hypothetical protein